MTAHRSPIVVKIGGNALGPQDTTFRDGVALWAQGVPLVVVHGGGATITHWLERQGVESRFVRGLRVTDKAALEVVTAVLCGLTNKSIVAAINAAGGQAVGISGVDAGIVLARVQDPELGRVGEVEKVDVSLVKHLLEGGYIPVIAPVSLESVAKNPGAFATDIPPSLGGELLNVNADAVAAAIAGALGAERLVFLTDVPGILNGQGQVLSPLTSSSARQLIEKGAITGGMIPKVEACLQALAHVGTAQIVDGRRAGALPRALENRSGSLILLDERL